MNRNSLVVATAALFLFFLSCNTLWAQTFPHPSLGLPPLNEWTGGGGSLSVAQTAHGVRLGPPGTADWGNCYVEGDVDTSVTPYLGILVTEVGRDAKWQLTVNDPGVHTLENSGEDIGLRLFDLRKTPANFNGRKHFRIYLTVLGAGKSIVVGGIGLFATPPSTASSDTIPLPTWTRMNNSVATLLPDGEVNLSINEGTTDQWGGITTKVTVDRAQFPLVEAEVKERSPNAFWRVMLGSTASGPEHQSCGTVAFNYADFMPTSSSPEIQVQLTCSRMNGGQTLRAGPVRFVAYPTASRELVRKTQEMRSLPGARPLLATGPFQLCYSSDSHLFGVETKNGSAALTTRFLEMPGFDLAPDTTPKAVETPTGKRITYRVLRNQVTFDVMVETRTRVPGLLHWRVTATPQRATSFPSCGHEIGYARFDNAQDGLQRITLQNLSASGLAYVNAPGVGNVFYFQNFTALNPVFQACHTSPRWLVSAGNQTLGFANPLDTSVTWEAGKSIVLSDTYLYLATQEQTPPSAQQDNSAQAEQFLTALATVYDVLPDKPETEWYDWQHLARQSLKDMEAGDCWRPYGPKSYLQAFVGLRGSVPQITSAQDVLAPLTWFKQQSGEGDALIVKLRDTLPDFWSEERKSLKEIAMPGDHIWYNIPNLVTLSRASLAGNTTLTPLCLKAADAMIQLAHETKYRFDTGPAGILFSMPSNPELAGPYLLYMMLAHELAPDDARFLTEARQAAATINRWQYSDSRETFWTAMGCEGLARLYAATHDKNYIRSSYVPLASLLRNAFLWESDFGYARNYRTFWGVNPDSSGIDYIAAMEQHQIWYALREYLRITEPVLPDKMQLLVAEFLRHAPATIWYSYPQHLAAEARFSGETFWKTDNNDSLYIPYEDLNSGWKKNGSVGQELYGAGAAFTIASQTYTAVPDAGVMVFSEYPLRKVTWDAAQKSLLLDVGGVSRYTTKIEVRPLAQPIGQGVLPWSKPAAVNGRSSTRRQNGTLGTGVPLQLQQATVTGASPVTVLRTTAPGNSLVRFWVPTSQTTPLSSRTTGKASAHK